MMYDHFIQRSDPFRAMGLIQDEMNRLFESTMGTAVRIHPPVNLWVADEEAVVTAELPGMESSDIHLSVQDDQLVIEGDRKEFIPKADEEIHRRERIFEPFKRSLALPFRVDAEKIHARYADGILTVRLPRHEAEKPRKIQIAGTAE